MKRKSNKVLSLLLTLVILPLWGDLPARAEAQPGTFTELQALLDAAPDGGTVVLDADYAAAGGEDALSVSGTVTLDLNGHILDRGLASPVENGCVITVTGELSLTDSDPAARHLNGMEKPLYTYVNEKGADTELTGGVITGGSSSEDGGGVNVAYGGTLTMTGGTIFGNAATRYGGGVNVAAGGTFTMKDGAVRGNTAASCGGGVNASGAFTLSGGEISGNTAPNQSSNYGGNGGGVYTGSPFSMSGGVIFGNTAGKGGGVYASGAFTLSGGVIIGNTAVKKEGNGGGVYFYSTFTVSGSPAVFGNLVSANDAETPNNVYLLSSSYKIAVGGDGLADGACIGVTMNTPGVFTSGGMVAGAADASRFFSDSADCTVICENGEAKLEAGAWASAISESGALQYVRLNDDISSGTLAVAEDTYVTLDLNGRTVSCPLTVSGSLTVIGDGAVNGSITVSGGGALTLSGGTVGNIKINVSGGTFTMNGGTVSLGTNASMNNGCVCVSNRGAFTMNGGAISGHVDLSKRYAVTVGSGCAFTMNGGTLSGGTEYGSSGGVNVSGKFTMNGGTISGYKTSAGVEPGVFVASGGTFEMNGGRIVRNMTTQSDYGGGVRVEGAFTMSGGAISGNAVVPQSGTMCGGGVLVKAGGTFEMTGGAISGNKATSDPAIGFMGGGGVCVSGTFTMSGGVIAGNNASGKTSKACGGGVLVAGSGTFTMSGGAAISDNTASDGSRGMCGGGVRVCRDPDSQTGSASFTAEAVGAQTLNTVLSPVITAPKSSPS